MSLNPLGSLFSGAWKLYRARWRVLVEIVLLPTLITVLGYVLMVLGTPFSVLGALVVFIGWVVFVFSGLTVIFSVHNDTGVDDSYKSTIGWFWPFLWIAALEVLAVVGGSIMLIIPGIWLSVALSLAAYVFVIERRRGIDALRQSKDYVKGYWWAVMGRVLLLALIFIAAAIVIEVPFAMIGGRAAASIAYLAAALFFIPYTAIYHYLIFQNLRELKPAMETIEKRTGGGFIMASAIVGVAVPVLIALALVILAAVGTAHVFERPPRYAPPGYGVQNY